MKFIPSTTGEYVRVDAINHVVLWPDFEDACVLAVTPKGNFKILRETWRNFLRRVEATA